MSVAAILTQGLGSWGTPSEVVLMGYAPVGSGSGTVSVKIAGAYVVSTVFVKVGGVYGAPIKIFTKTSGIYQ